MTAKQAKDAGYEICVASIMEVGLLKNGKGIKTWWCSEFDNKLPDLSHPLIMEAIEVNEDRDGWK